MNQVKRLLPIMLLTGLSVLVAQTPALDPAVQKVYGNDGTNITYICESPSFESTGRRPAQFLTISGITKANPAVATSTGHGFDANSRPSITITGATGTGWTAINTTWVATIASANTFSIATDSTGFGTLGGTVKFNTTAPRTTFAEWSIMKYVYDGSNIIIWSGYLYGRNAYNSKCSEAATAGKQQQ